MQEFRGSSLVAAALVERVSDQLDFVAFDFIVEVDAVAVEGDPLVIFTELGFQRFDLPRESFCECNELIDLHTSPLILSLSNAKFE
ncbi:MAG: hypothetical protein V7638_4965 [Acidobacteriota bacterium]